MKKTNWARVAPCGILSGVLLYFYYAFVNSGLLRNEWMNFSGVVKGIGHAPGMSTSMILWFLMAVVTQLGALWIYSAIRPKFGPGPVTAVRAAVVVWLVGALAYALNDLAIGLMPNGITETNCVAGLIGILACTVIGAKFYKE